MTYKKYISSITQDRRDGQIEGLSHGISSFLSFFYKQKKAN